MILPSSREIALPITLLLHTVSWTYWHEQTLHRAITFYGIETPFLYCYATLLLFLRHFRLSPHSLTTTNGIFSIYFFIVIKMFQFTIKNGTCVYPIYMSISGYYTQLLGTPLFLAEEFRLLAYLCHECLDIHSILTYIYYRYITRVWFYSYTETFTLGFPWLLSYGDSCVTQPFTGNFLLCLTILYLL